MGQDERDEVQDKPEREDLIRRGADQVEADLAVTLSGSSHVRVQQEQEKAEAATFSSR